MATADNRNQQPDPDQVKRGRRMALLLFAIGFGPMIFATAMYYTGWFNPAQRSNHGELVTPAVPVAELNLSRADGDPLESRFGPELEDPEWLMLVVAERCGDNCEQLLYLARQVNVALGKNANRVSRAAWLESLPDDLAARWDSEYPAMERLSHGGGRSWPEAVDPAQGPRLLLVDPFGNIMMQFDQDNTGKEILEDLKHLLKLSQIG